MNLKIREGIINLFMYLGVIILIMSILVLDQFELGFIVAFSCWTVSATLQSFYEEKKDIYGYSQGTKFCLKGGITTLLSMIGVLVLLIGIFIDVADFKLMLFIAIAIWISTGIITSFIGEESKTSRPHSIRKTSRSNNVTNTNKKTQTTEHVTSDTPVQDYYEEKPTKKYKRPIEKFCKNCGIKIASDAVFCDNCGSQL